MKRGLGYLLFLGGWASFVLNLPDLMEKIGKWIPILRNILAIVTTKVDRLISILPRAPDCGVCFEYYVFWPTLASMFLTGLCYVAFYFLYNSVVMRESKLKIEGFLIMLLGQIFVLDLKSGYFTAIPACHCGKVFLPGR
jgi:hypothetical protein